MKQQELYKKIDDIVGHSNFPHTVTYDRDGAVVKLEFESEWKGGGTEPITNDEGEVTGFKENYKTEKLTDKQVKALDDLIKTLG